MKTLTMPPPQFADVALGNELLTALPEGEFRKIRPALDEVRFETGDVLWESDEKGRYLFFPISALVSLLYETENGDSAAIAAIGREGVINSNVVLADTITPDRAVVIHSGLALRMKAPDVQNEFAECGQFQDIMVSYTQALLAQISHNAICNRLHCVEEQIARWLLMNYDHHQSDRFSMTHDQIAMILGVRRESVSLGASALKKQKLIDYSRGKIELLDIKGLLEASCECYTVVKEQYDAILHKYIATHGP
jgi:CRP-like cAMP-binding protein